MIEQNNSPNGRNAYKASAAQCFLTAGAPPTGCPAAGWYCGGDGVAGSPNVNYFCDAPGGTVTKTDACNFTCVRRGPFGGQRGQVSMPPTCGRRRCIVAPHGYNDLCAGGGTCAHEDSTGNYCGTDGIDGDKNTLFRCVHVYRVALRSLRAGRTLTARPIGAWQTSPMGRGAARMGARSCRGRTMCATENVRRDAAAAGMKICQHAVRASCWHRRHKNVSANTTPGCCFHYDENIPPSNKPSRICIRSAIVTEAPHRGPRSRQAPPLVARGFNARSEHNHTRGSHRGCPRTRPATDQRCWSRLENSACRHHAPAHARAVLATESGMAMYRRYGDACAVCNEHRSATLLPTGTDSTATTLGT